jgi:ribosomal protein L3
MAGHMGVVRVSIKNIKIVDLNNEDQTVFLNGAVPGNKNGRVELVKLNK